MDTKLDTLLAYVNRGLSIFPVWWMEEGHCACGNADCNPKNHGKHPITTVAPRGYLSASRDAETVTQWHQRYPQANWGLPMKGNALVALDIDPRNGGDVTLENLEAQHGPITSSWTQSTGGGGTHFVFKASDDATFPGKAGNGIDIKHPGYILIEPAVTRQSYLWIDGGPLDGDEPSALPQWLESLSKPMVLPQNQIVEGAATGFAWMSDFAKAELWSALNAIPNVDRDEWVHVGMALHETDPNPNSYGFDLWEKWSQRDPGGFKYNAQDQARVWHSFSRSKPEQLTLNSIYYMASQYGWTGHLDEETKAAIDRLTASLLHGNSVNTEDSVNDAPFAGKCPVPMIEDVAQWIQSRSGHGYRQAAMAGALMLCSMAASRRYIGMDGSPAYMYIGLSAKTINEIRYVLNSLEIAMSDSGLRRMVRSSRFGGVGSLYKSLVKSPSTHYLTAEWETLLKFAKRQPSGSIDMVLNVMADLHGRQFLQIDSAEEFGMQKLVTDEQPVIRHPSLSIFALMSHQAIDLLSKTSEIGRGATEQMLLVNCRQDDFIEREEPMNMEKTPSWLCSHLRTIRGLPDLEDTEIDTDLIRIFSDNCSSLNPHLIPVPIAGDYHAIDQALSDLSTSRNLRPIIQGAKINLRRLCVALAAWNNPQHPIVTQPIKTFIGGWLIGVIRQYIESLDVMMNDGEVDVGQRIVSAVMEAGKDGMNMKQIRNAVRKFGRLSADDRAKMMEKLVDDGDLVAGDPNGQKRGMRYVAPKYVVDLGARGPVGGQGSGPQATPATARDSAQRGQGATHPDPYT